MTDLDKINSIITKAQLLRNSTGITPREFMLADLVEALAHELLAHDREFRRHVTFIGSPPPGDAGFGPEPTTEEVEHVLHRFGFPRRHKDAG